MSAALLNHVLRRTLRSLRENAALNVAATAVIAVALLLLGVTLTVGHNVGELVRTWGQDVHMSLTLRPGLSDAARAAIEAELRARPEVESLRYVSSAEAVTWMAEQVDGIGPTLEELGPEALPASFELSLRAEVARDPAAVDAFARSLDRPEIDLVDYGAAWVERFQSFLSLLELFGAVLAVLVVAAAIFVVLNTVRLVVYSRRDELEIQRLVGGTDGFIVAPFALEGLIQGLAGGGLAVLGLWIVHQGLVTRLRDALSLEAAGELSFLPAGQLALLGFTGALVGGAASAWTAWRALARMP